MQTPSSPTEWTKILRALLVAFVLWFGTGPSSLALAQCTTPDINEPNQSCSAATPLHTSWTRGLSVSSQDSDYFSLWVPPGATCTVDLEFEHAQGDINVYVYASCGGVISPIVFGLSSTDNESVSWTNNGFLQNEYFVRVVAFQSLACAPYDIHASIPICPLDDFFELNNDICSLGGTPPPELFPGTYNGLASLPGDVDYYRVSVPPGATVDVRAWHDRPIGTFRLDVRPSCLLPPIATSIHTSGHEHLRWSSQSVATQDFFFRLFRTSGTPVSPCYEYGLTVEVLCSIDDSDENHDTCSSPLPISVGTLTNRIARLGDEDWYSVSVPNSATLDLAASFAHADANIDVTINSDSCPGGLLAWGFSNDDNEYMSWTNDIGRTEEVFVRVYVREDDWSQGPCASYDRSLSYRGGFPINMVPMCFGWGVAGQPQCPCSNHSPTNHFGGCAHQDGPGAILSASGFPRVSQGGGPEFQLESAPRNTFAVLVSGDNQLPQIGSCRACGIPSFDGLRCVGGNFKRHGSRATDSSGNSVAGWGPPSPPALGIGFTSGFAGGQTRHFQAFYRTALDQTCGSGQNSSNNLSVTFGL